MDRDGKMTPEEIEKMRDDSVRCIPATDEEALQATLELIEKHPELKEYEARTFFTWHPELAPDPSYLTPEMRQKMADEAEYQRKKEQARLEYERQQQRDGIRDALTRMKKMRK